MAIAFESRAGDRIAGGIVVTKDGHAAPAPHLRTVFAGHPVPDARSEVAGALVLAEAGLASPDEWLVVLLSGGASALLAKPLPGLAQSDVRRTTELLLGCGAPIGELNVVRKHLTAASGGRLAARTRAARIVVLAISDVLGDPPDAIGSGPCSADPSGYGDALAILAERGIAGAVPPAVRAHLEAGARGERPESPKPGAPAFERVRYRVLASNRDAAAAALAEARARGVSARLLEPALAGEARAAGRRLAELALAEPRGRETLLVAGGETTVTLRGAGRGGRSQELALAAALALAGSEGVALLAAGTDGTDGPTDAAGAFADGATVARGRAAGRDAAADLEANDSHAFFAAEGGLFRTGPTRTNALDLVLALRSG
jgi:glycerate-2-kinase